MCGILAVFCNKYPSLFQEIIKAVESIKNRGPDKMVSYLKSDGMYFFQRLSINDLSSSGDQPMFSSNGKILMMCNGEIYNHKELQQEYEIKCNSTSDCEIILRLYEKIGFVEMYKKLDGYFAIVLVDGDTVYLARDRIGVRPLFTGFTEEGFVAVASVPNALLPFCSRVEYFTPGCVVSFKKEANPTINCLYQEQIVCKDNRVVDNITEAIHDTLLLAVKKRLLTDRPIGCLLSGGLDSSIVCALLVKLLGPSNVRTYSIGMEGSTDLYYARKVATHLKTEHHEVLFTPDEGFAVIPKLIEVLGTYDVTTIRASVGMYLLSQYISKNTNDKVIFSGEGSDEAWCGYLYFHNAPSPDEAEKESLRLLREMHLYDVLRADRTVSSNGLELRVPFLDRDFLNLALSLLPEDKIPSGGYEKLLLRKAFQKYLPDDVAWRRKEGFSDGVSSVKKSWYEHIQERVEKIIPDSIFSESKWMNKEAFYYYLLFDKTFPTYNLRIPYWMPRWTDAKDPSGRKIAVYDEKQ